MSVIDFSNKPISILKNLSISDAIRMLLNTKVSRLIVVDDGKHVGIISFRDLFRISIEIGNEKNYSEFNITYNIRHGFLSKEGFGNISLARDIITRLKTVKFNMDLDAACEILLENNVSGLVMFDGNSGIFSKTDVVRSLVSV